MDQNPKLVYFWHDIFNPSFKLILSVLGAILLIYHVSNTSSMDSAEKLLSVNFEVFGRVQGVFFRKYTEKEANKLRLKGWCMNTSKGSVKGVIEGTPSKVDEMKHWLEKTGSPQSMIDKAVFSEEKEITKHTFNSFSIKR